MNNDQTDWTDVALAAALMLFCAVVLIGVLGLAVACVMWTVTM